MALAVLWLLPAVWVLVTSLKLTANIVRLPPEWIPWPATLAHYGEVLFSSSRTARIGRAFLNSTDRLAGDGGPRASSRAR